MTKPGFKKRPPACRRLFLREIDALPRPDSFNWRPDEVVVGIPKRPQPVDPREGDK